MPLPRRLPLVVSLALLGTLGTAAARSQSESAQFHPSSPISLSPQRPPSLAQPSAQSATVRSAQAVYASGEPVRMQFFGLPGNDSDWITVVRADAADDSYDEQRWAYTEGRKQGTMAFDGLPPGEYEARVYFNWEENGGYEVRDRARFRVEAADAADSLLGRNLLANGNAEAGPLGSPVRGWVTSGGFSTKTYGNSEYPSASAPGPSDHGDRFFYGGRVANSEARQTVDLAGRADAIDAGELQYELAGYLGGWKDQADRATVVARFMDGNGRVLDCARLNAVRAADRDGQTGLLRRQASGQVPSGTRKVEVQVQSVRSEGTSNDGYADNLSLVLSQQQ